jgi:hypothetical protein
MRRPRCNGKFNGRAEQSDLQRTAFPQKGRPRLTSPTPPPKSPVGGDRGHFTPPHSPNVRHGPKAKRLFVAGILAGARILAVAPASDGDAVAAFRDDVFISIEVQQG